MDRDSTPTMVKFVVIEGQVQLENASRQFAVRRGFAESANVCALRDQADPAEALLKPRSSLRRPHQRYSMLYGSCSLSFDATHIDPYLSCS